MPDGLGLWTMVETEFGTSSASTFRGWVSLMMN